LEPEDVIYLLRVFLALLVGVICGLTPLPWLYSVVIGVLAYASSIPLIQMLYGGGGILSKRTAVTSGMAAYAFIWLMVWILVYNIMLG